MKSTINMARLIVAMTPKGGIGRNNILPWHCRRIQKLFKEKTIGCKVLFGRKTLNSLPPLPDREVYCIPRNPSSINTNGRQVQLLSEDMIDTFREMNRL